VRHGLARVLSKAGVCSRSEAARWIADGRVRVSGRIIRDPEFPIASRRRRSKSMAGRWMRRSACT
jgi:23S rRNA pseudouridine2605 synthase